MKRLGLLRHAKSDWDDLDLRDFDRGLNDRGRRGAALIGRHIAESGIAWDAAIASPAERVRRTIDASGLRIAPAFDERAYLAGAATLMDLLREIEGDPGTVLLVGHNPGLQELVFRLVDPAEEDALFEQAAEKFPTAAFALLELAIESWADLAEGSGKLVRFTRPRDLDPALGPESR
ncbi:histidine phosphatase family protein [Altererythrobacter soli]|uniref:Histidine phosphatase family protein n=1 Tax=Croceibacterium soli TaxID=1739690 RepID=A0A6I4UQW0_9SPHN|nr:histidine phosphatase family protein [Croceibacterium soli]MXP41171.1 histidine phosphatase family protein [Croceibacterium soli]